MLEAAGEHAFYMSGHACGQSSRIACDGSRTSLGSGEPRGAENGPYHHMVQWSKVAESASAV